MLVVSWLKEEGRLRLYFSRHRLTGKSQARTDAVELANARGRSETLNDGVLEHRARDAGGRLTELDQKSEHLSTQLNRVPMPTIGKAVVSFALHPTRATDTRSCDAS